MKIHILNYEPTRLGGGWQAARYLYEGLGCVGYDEADIVLITGPTMATSEQVNKAKQDGKKIVLRLDNMPRHSNNSRNKGVINSKEFAEVADLIIYQSQWARNFLMPYIEKDGAVILNGVDLKIFNQNDRHPEKDSYLYVRSSRDEGKNWISAWYWFVNNNKGRLNIVGKFSPENLEYNFDFFNGEKFTFWGMQNYMPNMYKRNEYFLYTYICDACSNTLLEARASGCEIIDVFGALQTGGAPEIMALEDISVERMIKAYEVEIGKLL